MAPTPLFDFGAARMPGTLATIRVRLGAAMAVALAPVLLLGAAETTVAYQKDAQEQRASLGLAAERSAATARARMESASVLLETLAPESVGLECAQRLSEVTGRLAGYDNLIRFDRFGRVACAARSVPADALRRDRAWFIRLSQGMQSTIIRSPEGLGGAPALLAAERADDRNGAFDGALVALINLDSLRPNLADRALPRGTEVAIIDEQGRYISRTRPGAFGAAGTEVVSAARNGPGPYIYFGKDQDGESRVFSAAPLTGEVSVILSAPAESLFSWAGLNPLSSFMFPLLAFTLALTAVWVVTERVVVRWLAYLNRIAAIYAKGRLSVRPSQASHAPPEIRELAVTMADMAEAIAARDQSLRDSLTEKDALLREIHHRVKNNLQVISSLLNLQERSLADPAARAAMAETRQRVGALALIYRALYQGSDMRRVDLRQFLSDLIGQMVIEQQAKGMAVRTELTADELTIDPDKLAPLALFAVEAISNAQKHALAAHGGLLSVRFEVDGAEATLSISDEGGDAEPSLGGGIGVGRALMSAFARQLRGRMELAPNGRGGATARLIFPTPGLEKAPPRRTRQAGEGNQPTAQAS